MKVIHFCAGLEGWNGMANTARQFVAEELARGDDSQLTNDVGLVERTEKVDRVQIHGTWLPVLWKVAKLAKKKGAELIVRPCGNYDPIRIRRGAIKRLKKWLVGPLEHAMLNRADFVQCTCVAEANWVKAYHPKARIQMTDLKRFFNLKEKGEGRKENSSLAGYEWYDIIDPQKILGMPIVDISNAAYLSDRKEIKLAFHAFGRVVNEADGRMVVFPAASAGKMWFNSGTDIRGIAAEFANLFRRSLRAWSEPNAKIPAADKRRKLEAVHQYLSKFSNAGGEYYVRFTVKENIGGKSPRAEVHASVISSIHVYKKTEGAELSIPIKTQAEDSAPFVDNKIALFLGAVNGGEVKRCLHLLYLGRRHPLKGVNYLEQAVEEHNQSFEHSEHSNIRTIDLRIVSDHFGAELEKDWAWCDVLVLPTLSENFGRVVAEALERGKWVVTTDGAPVWAPPEAAEVKARGEGEQWRDRIIYLKGYRDGTDEERVKLLKEALRRFQVSR